MPNILNMLTLPFQGGAMDITNMLRMAGKGGRVMPLTEPQFIDRTQHHPQSGAYFGTPMLVGEPMYGMGPVAADVASAPAPPPATVLQARVGDTRSSFTPAPEQTTVAPSDKRDPIQTGATKAEKPGLSERWSGFSQSDRGRALADMFAGWAQGGTMQESMGYGAKMMALGRATRDEKQQNAALRTANEQWLVSQGYDPQSAKVIASDSGSLSSAIKRIYEGEKPLEINGQLVDPNTYQVVGDFRDKEVGMKPTDDMREYEVAKSQGFEGTFMDFMVKMKEAGRQQVNIDTGVKLPSGYQWKDPANQAAGVEPIAGGPATQIPAELAARIGMADNFLAGLPDLKKKVQAGDVTGLVDRAQAGWQSSSDQADVFRKAKSGTDALMRMLTGAGMNQTEAEEYAGRYLPTYTDDAASAVKKLEQLESELRSAKAMAVRGRGLEEDAPSDGVWTDLGNGVRIRKK